MARWTFALLLLCASVAAANGRAMLGQTPEGFSGHWVLASINPERPGYSHFLLGTESIVQQDAGSVTITRVSPPPRRELKFIFKGDETRSEHLANDQKFLRDSRATLGRGTLLISTDTTNAKGERWLSNISRWSIEPDGTLVVGDTEICGRGECPSVVTTLKFKRKP